MSAYGVPLDKGASPEDPDRPTMVFVDPADARTFGRDLLVAHGLTSDDAFAVADALVAAAVLAAVTVTTRSQEKSPAAANTHGG